MKHKEVKKHGIELDGVTEYCRRWRRKQERFGWKAGRVRKI